MDFTAIFQAYYSLYRADSDVPTSTDAEYTVGLRLANEAVNRWAHYDGIYWKELFTTLQADGGGTQTITTGNTTYTTPDNFKEAGGYVKVVNSDGNTVQRYPIIESQEAQFQGDNSNYCYFTGSPVDGYILNLNPAPTSNLSGLDIDYVYYKAPTEFEAGADITEMADPYFIIHRMLANQFRAARNPYYSSAKSDAENALRQMQLDNNSGSWDNPLVIADNSGMSWGV